MPIFFRWYKHSFFASIVSIFGSVTIATGIASIFTGGGIFYGIGIALAGFFLLWLGGKIADRKAAKLAAKQTAQLQSTKTSSAIPQSSGSATTASSNNASVSKPSTPPTNQSSSGTVSKSTSASAGTSSTSKAATDTIPRNLSLKDSLRLASKYASAGDTENQIKVLKKATEDYPKEASVYNLLGIAYRSAGQYSSSINCYRHAVMLDPDNGIYHGNYAISLMMSGDMEGALSRFERALPLLKKENSPDYAMYLANYAYTLGKCGYKENALRCLDDAEKAGYAHADQIRSKLEKMGIHN